MRALVIALILILAMSFSINSAYSLNSKEFIFGDASGYGIDGYGVDLTIAEGQPIFTLNSTIISFTLNILEPFSARGTTVNQSDYFVNRKTLDFYLISGVVVDYDRSRLIDTLWINWGNSLNATHVQEEKILYSQIYWVNFTKSGNSYFGTATLPKLSGGPHNATIWVRAEQDQVTTYIPFWSVFSKSMIVTNPVSTPTPTPSVPEFSWLMILPLFLSTIFIAVLIRKRTSILDNVNNFRLSIAEQL
jgi:hypothetical protein